MRIGHESYRPPTFDETTSLAMERSLSHGESISLDISRPILGGEETLNQIGAAGNLVAVVSAGNHEFFVVDTRHLMKDGTNRGMMIVDRSLSVPHRKGFKGVIEGEPTTIGRLYSQDRFDYSRTVSGEHFSVDYSSENDELIIHNFQPTNETRVTGCFKQQNKLKIGAPEPSAIGEERTIQVGDRVSRTPGYSEEDETAPYGYYLGYPILGRASKQIGGTVSLGGGIAREALVADSDAEVIDDVYWRVIDRARQSFDGQSTVPVQSFLESLKDVVREFMPPNNLARTNEFSEQFYGDALVGLSKYVENRVGVCRHQSLLAGVIVEKLIEAGSMTGRVNIERNENKGNGAHAWATYRYIEDGELKAIVVDPTLDYVGTKEGALENGPWDYRLSTDQKAPEKPADKTFKGWLRKIIANI